ncbi:MAG: glycerol kinase GlpK [Erythrobacter sp.]
MTQFILVLDEGTTSTRAMLFDTSGTIHGTVQEELTQHYPQAGRVEHDAAEIWDKALACARSAIEQAGGPENIACIGITNQRETVVAWDRKTGKPLTRAIVWQDRRTEDFCKELRDGGHLREVQRRTGLLLDPYFSGTKMRWMLDNVDEVREAAAEGTLAFGTIESWLTYKLTGGEDGGAHITDASNASRTMLMELGPQSADAAFFDSSLCDLLGVPHAALPQIVDNAGELAVASAEVLGAAIPITGMAGDQQSATIGQGCLEPGETKATYGTGAFVLANKGAEIPSSENRMLGTVLYQIGGKRTYALEGSVFVAGSLVQWLRDALGLFTESSETQALANSVESTGGVTIVPALSGLGAPHWRAEARGVITGLSFATGKAEIACAALEAMAHQTYDLSEAFTADDAKWEALRIDGGMSANDWMAQDIANMLGLTVERPDNVETTALGTAMLAATGAGLYTDLASAAKSMRGGYQTFTPEMNEDVRDERLVRWRAALSVA